MTSICVLLTPYALNTAQLNVVVYVVVRHWVEEMIEIAGWQGGRRDKGRYQNSLFYVDNGMIAL